LEINQGYTTVHGQPIIKILDVCLESCFCLSVNSLWLRNRADQHYNWMVNL